MSDTIRMAQQLIAVYVNIYSLYLWSALQFTMNFQTIFQTVLSEVREVLFSVFQCGKTSALRH